MAEQKCACGHVWGDPVPITCRVLRADGHFTVARTLYYPYHQLWLPGSKGYLVHITSLPPLWHIRNAYVAMFGVTLSSQTAVSLGWMVIYGSQNPVLPVPPVMSPLVQGLFVHIAALPTIMADQECVCGHVWGDPAPTNCRVHKADGHFTVARTLYYRYHQLWVPWSKVYLVHITPLLP